MVMAGEERGPGQRRNPLPVFKDSRETDAHSHVGAEPLVRAQIPSRWALGLLEFCVAAVGIANSPCRVWKSVHLARMRLVLLTEHRESNEVL